MENQDKKKTNPAIDEEFLMSMMAGEEKPKESVRTETRKESMLEKAVSKEKARAQKTSEVNYEKLFFTNPDTNARNGKSVYIRPEFHERLSRIVQVIAEDKLTIYAYLDNILEYHFQEFGEQIITSFNEKYKPIL